MMFNDVCRISFDLNCFHRDPRVFFDLHGLSIDYSWALHWLFIMFNEFHVQRMLIDSHLLFISVQRFLSCIIVVCVRFIDLHLRSLLFIIFLVGVQSVNTLQLQRYNA